MTLKESEFDKFTQEYSNLLRDSTRIFGEDIDFFSEYKVKDVYEFVFSNRKNKELILDFGSGIGNSIPWFRKYFPGSELICSDISRKSLELSSIRFPGKERYLLLGDNIELPDNSIDIIFSSCVFHHIPLEEHSHWLNEMRRVLKKGGIVYVFEHNPLNPLTRRTVNQCPFDENAILIYKKNFIKKLYEVGFSSTDFSYRLFFPNQLAFLRPLEKYLKKFFFGAQYSVMGIK